MPSTWPAQPMIHTLLIANRGEIALRVLRTCREMGIRAIAVYSDADRDSPLVEAADLAVRVGASPPAESYLDGERLVAIAAGNQADAVHPGYGFLAENPDFSAACRERGLIFVGPPPEVIAAMANKAEAKRRMAQADVPSVPGYSEDEQDEATLRAEAGKIGFPLFIKAVAGGGGRGIRLVEREEDFAAALESARRQAASAFGDDRMMLERYLAAPRHVEIQVLADTHGNVVHLFERECSAQRRHQKIVEETPSPALDPALREAMGAAAVRAARSIGYVGAGTVEFLLDEGKNFYFLEMNTRLQVEHPVTEMILGLDLVRLQIEVAEGRPLPFSQADLAPAGHAIECRLYAEDPRKGFLPAVGTLRQFSFPAGPGLRVDAGFRPGSAVTPYYDSLLAKLVAWAPDRGGALRKMADLLARSFVTGPATNLSFLQSLLAREEFQAGDYDTQWVERILPELATETHSPAILREQILAAAAIDAHLESERLKGLSDGAIADGTPPDGHSGNSAPGALRPPNLPWAAAPETLSMLRRVYSLNGQTFDVEITLLPQRASDALEIRATWDGVSHRAGFFPTDAGRALLDLGEVRLPLMWDAAGDRRWVSLRGIHGTLISTAPQYGEAGAEAPEAAKQKLEAPLPGKVIKVAVAPGQSVSAGDLLAVVEAVKMEHPITAPFAGKVTAVHFQAGDPVDKGDLLLDLEPEEG